ncbi:lipoprotein [Streptomyces sp. KHY 26]|uniref:lipoprotein n=1 Tax=Streptomyces sp. KHY 26 TaxID=3097359 RepID=UPI00376EDC03
MSVRSGTGRARRAAASAASRWSTSSTGEPPIATKRPSGQATKKESAFAVGTSDGPVVVRLGGMDTGSTRPRPRPGSRPGGP